MYFTILNLIVLHLWTINHFVWRLALIWHDFIWFDLIWWIFLPYYNDLIYVVAFVLLPLLSFRGKCFRFEHHRYTYFDEASIGKSRTTSYRILISPKTVDPMTFCIASNWNELSDMRQPYLSWLLMISYYFIEHFEEWYDM